MMLATPIKIHFLSERLFRAIFRVKINPNSLQQMALGYLFYLYLFWFLNQISGFPGSFSNRPPRFLENRNLFLVQSNGLDVLLGGDEKAPM